MRYTRAQIAHRVNRLAALRARIRQLEAKANDCVLAILKNRGGSSSKWTAKLVRQPEKTMVVKAHTQVRLYPARPAGGRREE